MPEPMRPLRHFLAGCWVTVASAARWARRRMRALEIFAIARAGFVLDETGEHTESTDEGLGE